MSGPAVTAVVPTRGMSGLLRRCLDDLAAALAEYGPADHQVVVVDNATPFPIQLEQPPAGLRVLRFDTHHSFSRCNNAAVERWPSPLVLLLNNDVLLHPQAIRSMTAELERTPRAAVCGTRLLFPDGTIQHRGVSFAAGDDGPVHADRGRPAHLVPRDGREWQAVTGACMLIRHPVWVELGGFDESYPFGLEDIDLCLRARLAGWRVRCVQDTDSLHLESATPGRVALDRASRALFMQRWKGRYAVDMEARP